MEAAETVSPNAGIRPVDVLPPMCFGVNSFGSSSFLARKGWFVMKKLMFVAAALALLAISSAVQADPLPPGTEITFGASASGGVTGTVQATKSGTFTTQGGDTGTVTEEAVLTSTGTYDFLYQIQVTGGPSGSAISQLAVRSYFFYPNLSVSQQNGTGGTVTGDILLSGGTPASTAQNLGGTINFNFGGGGLAPGSYSQILVVSTSANSFDAKGNVSVQDGGVDFLPNFLQPTPEPASLVLFGGLALGMSGAGLRRWRQRKTVSA